MTKQTAKGSRSVIPVYIREEWRLIIEEAAAKENRSLSNFLITAALELARDLGIGRPKLVKNASDYAQPYPEIESLNEENRNSNLTAREKTRDTLSVIQAYCYDDDRAIIEEAAKVDRRSNSNFLISAGLRRANEMGIGQR